MNKTTKPEPNLAFRIAALNQQAAELRARADEELAVHQKAQRKILTLIERQSVISFQIDNLEILQGAHRESRSNARQALEFYLASCTADDGYSAQNYNAITDKMARINAVAEAIPEKLTELREELKANRAEIKSLADQHGINLSEPIGQSEKRGED